MLELVVRLVIFDCILVKFSAIAFFDRKFPQMSSDFQNEVEDKKFKQ